MLLGLGLAVGAMLLGFYGVASARSGPEAVVSLIVAAVFQVAVIWCLGLG